jgi:nicotinate dehydrogenase subunit B
MTGLVPEKEFSRKSFLKAGGALVVGFSMAGPLLAPGKAAAAAATRSAGGGAFPLATHPILDNWLVVHQDGTVTFSVEKSDIGTHMQTGLLQIAAEELDVSFERMRIQSGDTSRTPDLGTSSSSAGITGGGPPVRAAAATARQALVGMASAKLGVPVSQLTVQDGVVSVIGNASQSVTYAQLIGGQRFNITMDAQPVVGSRGPIYGTAPTKDPTKYTVVGTSVAKRFVPEKVMGTHSYVTDVRIPGMVHARAVRPPTTGARLLSLDKSSISHIPGIVDVVVKKDYVAVVAEDEWAAIQAAQQLKVSWSKWSGGPQLGHPSVGNLYSAMRAAPHIDQASDARGTVTYPARNVGNVDAALAGAAKVVSATYESPYYIHGPIGPAAAVADVRGDQAIVWSASQNIFGMRPIVATLLSLPEQNVRFISLAGPSAFGDSNTDDCAAEACLLSQAVGRPVRLQYMRWDDHVWDSGRSARVTDLRGGLDAQGKVVAIDLQTWSAANGGRPYGDAYATQGLFSDYEFPNPSSGPSRTAGGGIPGTSLLPPVLMGAAPEFDVEGMGSASVGNSNYTFANMRWVLHYLGKGSPRAEPLDGRPQAAPAGSLRFRTSSESGTGGVSTTFASESFIDELAAAAGADPIQFRLANLTNPRNIALVNALAQRAGWQSRPSPGPDATSSAVIARGRGMAVSASATKTWAEVFEVEVNRKTGKVSVPRVVAAIETGLIINPDAVTQQIEGNTLFGISEALKEQRMFDQTKITSRDWVTYPILRFNDAPQEIDVLLVDRPDLPSGSASELNQLAGPAISNAIFDATGVRMRTLPFTPKRVLAALKQAGKAM